MLSGACLTWLPHSKAQFDPSKDFLHQDLIYGPPEAHLLIKWTKTLQDNKSHHVVQLPESDTLYLCPVKALKALLTTRQLPLTGPLFTTNNPPFHQVIDNHVRQTLKIVLTIRNIKHVGYVFHTFRRSGAILNFGHNIPLQNIYTVYCGVRPYGPTCKMALNPLLSTPLLSLPSFPTGLGVLKFPFMSF